jgi:predicted metalloendopeptidase
MDLDVKPCDDLYGFSCNAWIKKTEMPDSRLQWNRIAHTQDYITDHVRVLLDNGVNPERSTSVEKAIIFFKTCRNSTERQGHNPKYLKDALLEKEIYFPLIDPAFSSRHLSRIIVKMNQLLIPGRLFSIGVKSDQEPSKQKNLITISPSITTDSRKSLRPGYVKLMTVVFKAVGITLTSTQIEEIIEFETKLLDLASKSPPTVSLIPYSELMMKESDYDPFIWRTLLEDFKNKPNVILMQSTISVTKIDFFKKASVLIRDNLEIFGNYLGWKSLQYFSQFTTIDLRQANFEFQNQTYQVPAQVDLAPQCVEYVTNFLPFAVGRLFYQDVRRVESLAGTIIIMDYVKRAMINKIEKENTWLDPVTKKAVIAKIKGIVVDYFFPHDLSPPRAPYKRIDQLYHDIEIPAKTSNLPMIDWISSMNKFTYFKSIRQLNKEKPDETSLYTWTMSPTSNTASYITSWNLIVVPSGMMFEPYFVPGRPPAVNFGSLGFVFAHEVSHAFDTLSRKMDANGERMKREEWTEASLKEYQNRTDCFVSQYDKYEWSPGKTISGSKTLNENMADSEGLRLAYEAFNLYLKHHPHDREQRLPKEMRGFTPHQLFFISFANVSNLHKS